MSKRKRNLRESPKTESKMEDITEDITEDETEELPESQGEFWAEDILDWGLHDNGTMMYLVKWEGYPDSENSWEFQQHVKHCSDLLIKFHTTRVNGIQHPKWSFDEFDKFYKVIEQLLESQDLAVFRKISKREFNCFEIRDKEIIDEIKTYLRSQFFLICDQMKNSKNKTNAKRLEVMPVIKNVAKNLNIFQNFGSISQFFDFIERRDVLTKELKEWEKTINEVIVSQMEGKSIRVVNDIDLEKPNLKRYITDYIIDIHFEDRIKLEDEKPLIGCQCNNCYESRDECCTAVVGFPMVYNSKGLLNSQTFNTVIYECNSKCGCAQSCPNRQIQRGRQFELEIFRTDNESRGWGVRTLQVIPKGSFITRYTGEVISILEAEKRPSTYLFDLSAHLESNDAEFTYVVDASQYGNVTRFINHSCAPNCRVLFAWIKGSTNKLLPIIALFAEQQIQINEELTYDYAMESIDFCQNSDLKYHQMLNQTNDSEVTPMDSQTNAKNKFKPRKVAFKRIECQCGADLCRNFLYS